MMRALRIVRAGTARRVRWFAPLALAAMLLPTVGCGDAGAPEADPPVTAEPADHVDASGTATDAQHAHGTAAPGEGQTLLVIMRQLATDMGAVSQALWLEDWEAVAAHSGAIADHAPISPGELERVQSALGAEMAGFGEIDEAVHQASVRMHEAAEARDVATFMDAFTEVQRGCVSCHSRYRETLRSPAP